MENIVSIIRGCINRDPGYQKQLYERYKGFACKIVFRYVYHYENAVDVVTDGFIKAFSHFSTFKITQNENPEKLLMGWLKQIMINCSIDALRSTNMLPEIGGISDEVWNISNKNDNADQLTLYKDLICLIKKLPPKYRVVFNLHVIDGYSHQQIADILEIPAGTSRANCSRAKSLLLELITKSEQTYYAGLPT